MSFVIDFHKEIKIKAMDTKNKKTETKPEEERFPGYPHYPEKEDIYKMEKKEPLDDENPKDEDGPDLDVPGSELDDKNEVIGEEDEENNYYSLGGDEHNDLEENGIK